MEIVKHMHYNISSTCIFIWTKVLKKQAVTSNVILHVFKVAEHSFQVPMPNSRQELHASPPIEHFPLLSYPYISIYGYVLPIYGYVG